MAGRIRARGPSPLPGFFRTEYIFRIVNRFRSDSRLNSYQYYFKKNFRYFFWPFFRTRLFPSHRATNGKRDFTVERRVEIRFFYGLATLELLYSVFPIRVRSFLTLEIQQFGLLIFGLFALFRYGRLPSPKRTSTFDRQPTTAIFRFGFRHFPSFFNQIVLIKIYTIGK